MKKEVENWSFQFGAFKLIVLSDGVFPVSKEFFFADTPPELIDHLPNKFDAPLNFLLIDMGEKKVLVDAGFGEDYLPTSGQLLKCLVVRVKGIAWCATRNEFALSVSQAGPSIQIEPVAYWVATMPIVEQEAILSGNPHIKAEWDPEFGDRMTQLVFIGTDMNEKEVSRQLDACLLTSDEFDLDWKLFKDPFHWDIPERD
ncbi:MAG TPA: GTP-binding protein [Metabacillus sp.]|nr:GTP-binding protein [Metabacillus sp.]